MDGANFYFNISPETYEVSLYFNVANSGDSIRIGLKNTFNNSWVIFDNFRLLYNGAGAQAYYEAIKTLISKLETVFDNAQIISPVAAGKVNTAKDELNAALNSSDADVCAAAITSGENALAYAKTSISDYFKLEDAYNRLYETYSLYYDTATPSVVAEATELVAKIEDAINNPTLTNEEIEACIAKAETTIVALKLPDYTGASSVSPVEFTEAVIVNHNFDDVEIGDFTGWSSGFGAGGETDHNAEIYQNNFDVHQDINGLIPGYYVAYVQGYYRHGSSTNDYDVYTGAKENTIDSYFYVVSAEDSVKTPVAFCSEGAVPSDVASGFSSHGTSPVGDGLVIPNFMVTATDWFNVIDEEAAGPYYFTKYYNHLIQAKVGEDGKLRIGVMKKATVEADWAIFDNFKLFFIGQNPDPTINTAIEEVEVTEVGHVAKGVIYNLAGQRLSAPVKGLNIIEGKKYFIK